MVTCLKFCWNSSTDSPRIRRLGQPEVEAHQEEAAGTAPATFAN